MPDDDTRSLGDRRKQAVATARSLLSGKGLAGAAADVNIPSLLRELNSYAVQSPSASEKQTLRDLALRLRQEFGKNFRHRGTGGRAGER